MYIMELIESRHKGQIVALLNGYDGATPGIAAVYFLFVSRDVNTFMLGYTIICTIALVLNYLLAPESPKWLLLNGHE